MSALPAREEIPTSPLMIPKMTWWYSCIAMSCSRRELPSQAGSTSTSLPDSHATPACFKCPVPCVGSCICRWGMVEKKKGGIPPQLERQLDWATQTTSPLLGRACGFRTMV